MLGGCLRLLGKGGPGVGWRLCCFEGVGAWGEVGLLGGGRFVFFVVCGIF